MIKAFDIKSNEVNPCPKLGVYLRISGMEQVRIWHRKVLKLQKDRHSIRQGPHWMLHLSQNPPTLLLLASVIYYHKLAWKSTRSVSPFSTTPKNVFFKVKIFVIPGDSHLWNCKEEVNEFLYCQQKPSDYVEFLKMSTPQQRLPKRYNYVQNEARYDWNWSYPISIFILTNKSSLNSINYSLGMAVKNIWKLT